MSFIESLLPNFGEERKIGALACGAEILSLSRRSALPKTDLAWIRKAVLTAEHPDVLIDNILPLLRLADGNKVRREITRRQAASRVNLMNLVSPFPYREAANITAHTFSLQLTDGCSVGCPWCGICAKRGVESAFSLSSVDAFSKKFRYEVRAGLKTLYYASDPFDWIDGERTYPDLINVLMRNAGSLGLFTSTAVPEGSEISILRFLDMLYQGWKKSQVKGVVFRFSQTQDNSQRVNQILDSLRAKGAPEDFIKTIVVKERNENKVLPVGYFIKHPRRKAMIHTIGIDCFDGVYIAPHKGIVAKTLTCVTLGNPTGTVENILSPGMQEIPESLHTAAYSYHDQLSQELFPLLPETKYKVYKKGKLVGDKIVCSVGRDVLAFDMVFEYFYHLLGPLEKPENPANLDEMAEPLARFRDQFAHRAKICLLQCDGITGEEDVATAREYIYTIESWLAKVGYPLREALLC